jgi:hypothetical protein
MSSENTDNSTSFPVGMFFFLSIKALLVVCFHFGYFCTFISAFLVSFVYIKLPVLCQIEIVRREHPFLDPDVKRTVANSA